MTSTECDGCMDTNDCGCGLDGEHHDLCEVCDWYICGGTCGCAGCPGPEPLPTDLVGYPGVTE